MLYLILLCLIMAPDKNNNCLQLVANIFTQFKDCLITSSKHFEQPPMLGESAFQNGAL